MLSGEIEYGGGLSAEDWRDQVFYRLLIKFRFGLGRTGMQRCQSPFSANKRLSSRTRKARSGTQGPTHCRLPLGPGAPLRYGRDDKNYCSLKAFARERSYP